MTKRSREGVEATRVGIAISTSVLGNSTAFGFSVMITSSFATVMHLEGSPRTGEILAFAVAAALAVAVWEGGVTRGFRDRIEGAPPEVSLLGTSLSFLSVAAGIAAALVAAELVSGFAAWPIGAAAAAATFIFAESAEILLAEEIQRARGDPEANKPKR